MARGQAETSGPPKMDRKAEALLAEMNEERDAKRMCRVCREFDKEALKFIELAMAAGHTKAAIARKLEPYYGSCESAIDGHIRRHKLSKG